MGRVPVVRHNTIAGPALSSPLAPSPLGAALKTHSSGPPKDRCRHSLTGESDGCGKSIVGSASGPRRIIQTRHRRVGAHRVTTDPTTASTALPDVANVPDESRSRSRLDGLLYGPNAHGTRAVCLGAARAPTPTNHPPQRHGASYGDVDG